LLNPCERLLLIKLVENSIIMAVNRKHIKLFIENRIEQ
jgi:hypothetical protein